MKALPVFFFALLSLLGVGKAHAVDELKFWIQYSGTDTPATVVSGITDAIAEPNGQGVITTVYTHAGCTASRLPSEAITPDRSALRIYVPGTQSGTWIYQGWVQASSNTVTLRNNLNQNEVVLRTTVAHSAANTLTCSPRTSWTVFNKSVIKLGNMQFIGVLMANAVSYQGGLYKFSLFLDATAPANAACTSPSATTTSRAPIIRSDGVTVVQQIDITGPVEIRAIGDTAYFEAQPLVALSCNFGEVIDGIFRDGFG